MLRRAPRPPTACDGPAHTADTRAHGWLARVDSGVRLKYQAVYDARAVWRNVGGKVTSMLVTTTPSVEGKRITKYCGVVTGEAILGANIIRDFFAGVRDIVGGRAASYEKELHQARAIALQELEEEAAKAGANAVVGIDLDYEVVGQGASMLMVSATGTAVVVE